MSSADYRFPGHARSALPDFASAAEGDVGWQAKRLVVKAWQACWQFDLHQLEQRLAQLRRVERGEAARRHMLVQHETLLAAGLALVRDDIDTVVRLADRVARGTQTTEMARVTALMLRFGAWRRKDWAHFEVATSLCPCSVVDQRRTMPAILTLVVEAAAEMKRTRQVVARRFAADAMRLASRLRSGRTFALANAAAVFGELLYEQGELDEANALLRRHLPHIARQGCPDALEAAFSTLSRIAFHRGQWKMAGMLLQELVDVARARGWPRVMVAGHLLNMDLRYCLRDLEGARIVMRDLQRLLNDGKLDLPRRDMEHVNRQAALRLGALAAPSAELVAELRRCIEQFDTEGDESSMLGISMILVEVLALLGEENQALAAMCACLKTGMRRGMFQSFFRGSAILRDKMAAVYAGNLLARGADTELRNYLASLIGRERDSVVAPAGGAGAVNKHAITARERDILLRMRQGHSNKKIARDLGIGPETVKSHAKRIFCKFGVATRIEAVSCANDLSLI